MTLDEPTILELAREFDRLRGTNVCRVGTALELAIDEASGRTVEDDEAFKAFLRDEVFPRMGGWSGP